MTPELQQCRFLRAARREPTDTTPIWIMRQAGRYLPEYRAVRSKVSFLELCKRPELAAEVTLTAQQALGVDAAILFADLLPILEPMGFQLEYTPGDGPAIHNPVRTQDDLSRVTALRNVDELGFRFRHGPPRPQELAAGHSAVGLCRSAFHARFVRHRRGRLARLRADEADHVRMPRTVGRPAAAVGRFVRHLSRCDRSKRAARPCKSSIVGPAAFRRPTIASMCCLTRRASSTVFPPGCADDPFPHGKPGLAAACSGRPAARSSAWTGGSIWARPGRRVGYDVAVQGNLDPVVLQADLPTLKKQAKAVLDAAAGRPGHIFNLGHGVLPETDPNNVKALVSLVHELGASRR